MRKSSAVYRFSKIQLIIPILTPESSFFIRFIPLLQNQTVGTDILIINSGGPIPEGAYEVIPINRQDFNHANTRNLALEYDADFYLFMTQDAMPCDDALIENLLSAFDDPEVVVSYARQIPYSEADPIERFARETNYPLQSRIKSIEDLPELGIKTFFSSDSCAMYRGDYFREIGGFQKDLNTNEDMEYAARAIMAGKKVAYCAEATVYHSHHFSWWQTWKRYVQIGRFFAKNDWILEEAAKCKKAESTGVAQALSEIKHLARTAPYCLPRSIAVSALKYIAFKYGMKR